MTDQWLFSWADLYASPSVADGMSFDQERVERAKGCHYLLAVGAKLNLPQLVVMTASSYFHRFFMRQSMKRHHVYDIAATCLFIAAKVEEYPRRIKDFVLVCAQKAQKKDKLVLHEESKEFNRWRNTMLFNEVVVLEALCFDLEVEHPLGYLLDLEPTDVPLECTRKAGMLLHQCLGLPLCVMYKPSTIAVAALLLSYHLSSLDVPPPDWWWTRFQADTGQINEVAAQMLEFFQKHFVS